MVARRRAEGQGPRAEYSLSTCWSSPVARRRAEGQEFIVYALD